jgi:hypothetical protein
MRSTRTRIKGLCAALSIVVLTVACAKPLLPVQPAPARPKVVLQQTQAPSEEQLVWRALLANEFADNVALAILDSTSLPMQSKTFPEHYWRALDTARAIAPAMLVDFRKANAVRQSLAPVVASRTNAILISDSVVEHIRQGTGDPLSFWTTFWQTFTGPSYLIRMSAVGFSEDHATAIVDFSAGCGGRCGHQGVYLLRKTEAGWQVQAVINGLIS